MPFDGFDPGIENPVRVLELIEERLQSGRMWARGCTFAADGRVCLLGAHETAQNVGGQAALRNGR